MFIRKARPEDAASISELAHSLQLNSNEPQKDGFLKYPLSESGYIARMSSPFFYVAESENGLEGFLMCYDSQNLESLIQKGLIEHEDGLVDYLRVQPNLYVYGDQIGIKAGIGRHKVGTALMQQLFKDMLIRNISEMHVGILHSPVRNYASISFCDKHGFQEIAEVKNKDETTWGMYKVKIF